MTEREILDALTRIVRDLTGEEDVVLTPTMTGQDVPGWDSATYVNFIVAVEIELGVKFPLADIESFKSFGDIVNAVRAQKDVESRASDKVSVR